jgi:BirA family biotin operon repressor/biotin-[acetyl-CoA-carboxylase] ligase
LRARACCIACIAAIGIDRGMSDHAHERELLQRLATGPISGDLLAREAGLTRAAVWKRIETLRNAGISIAAVPGRGYQLEQSVDLLDADSILASLAEDATTQLASLEVAWSLDSTNSELLRRETPVQGCAVLLAERQTGGRGRRGRTWASPLAAHVYLTIGRHFDGGLARLGGLSLVAGIAACEALRELGHAQVGLKWPNDLVVADSDGGLRKLGGLLVEGGGEHGGAARAVIGLGVNVRMPLAMTSGIDQPWVDLATLSDPPPSRNTVVAQLLKHLLPALAAFDTEGLAVFLPRFAALDALADHEVQIQEGSQTWSATSLGIAADGALRVRDAQGRERQVHAADVSLRAA